MGTSIFIAGADTLIAIMACLMVLSPSASGSIPPVVLGWCSPTFYGSNNARRGHLGRAVLWTAVLRR